MGYYISPRFLDKISVHITKNFLDLPNVKVPLILGIHGRKGEGKSFMCELVYKRMGIGVVYMSAGELESPDAGDPARLVRLRYREAGEWSRMHGRMAVLMINDLDAGVGRVDQFTQYTVNTQLVNATLMNIADNPTNVQLPGSYEEEPTQRIPIVVTGNDFSTLYAPLIRDGRMEKFYWDPDRDDRIGIVGGIFEVDAIAHLDIATLVDAFPAQSIDFFSALRSRLYDEQVRHLIEEVGVDKISKRVMNSTEALPEFHRPDFSLSHLMEVGQQMVREQERIRELRLVHEYNEPLQTGRRLGEVHWSSVYPDAKHETGRTRRSAYEEPPASNGHGSHASSSPMTHGSTPQATPSTTVVTNSAAVRGEDQEEIRRLIQQGYQVGIEYVDARRFRTNSWQSCAICQGDEEEAIAKLSACLTAHPKDYVRLVGIHAGDRRRLFETIIQRP